MGVKVFSMPESPIGFLVATKEKLGQIAASKYFAASFHVPLAGGFLALLLLPYLIKKRQTVDGGIKTGVTAQIVVPAVFGVGSLLRYILWLFELDLVNEILGYVFAVYLIAGYALMTYNTYRVLQGKRPAYKWFNEPLRLAEPVIFS